MSKRKLLTGLLGMYLCLGMHSFSVAEGPQSNDELVAFNEASIRIIDYVNDCFGVRIQPNDVVSFANPDAASLLSQVTHSSNNVTLPLEFGLTSLQSYIDMQNLNVGVVSNESLKTANKLLGVLSNRAIQDNSYFNKIFILAMRLQNDGSNLTYFTEILRMRYAQDVFQLAQALSVDVSSAKVMTLKGGSQYTVLPINKKMALDLEEKTGISLPIKLIERYGEIHTDYVYALNNREARNPKQAERYKAYANEYIEKLSNLSLPGKIQALSLYEAGKSEEMGRGMNNAMLAMQVTQLQSGIEILVGYLNGEDLNFDTDLDIVGNGDMLKRRAPGTSSMITEEYMANLSEINEYASLKSRREVEELKQLLEKAKILAGFGKSHTK